MVSIKNWERDKETLKRVSLSIGVLSILVVITAYILSLQSGSFMGSLNDSISLILHVNISGAQYPALLFLLSFLGLVFTIYLIVVIIEIFLQGNFQKNMKEGKILQRIKKMKDHYVVLGGGSLGEAVARELKEKGKDVIVLDADNERVKEMNDENILAMEGDCFEKEFLEAVNIKTAKIVIVCLNDDGDNLLTSMIVKDMNPKVKIIAEATFDKYAHELEKIGVDKVIVPRDISGQQIARQALDL